MPSPFTNTLGSVVFIPHGGGPLPLLGDNSHANLVNFLQALPARLIQPRAIVVISAHWETQQVRITSAVEPGLLYDYSGFPKESYQIQYPATGDPELAEKIQQMFTHQGITAHCETKRGLDHGVFIPLKIMYPEANIPVLQLSLLNSLDAAQHIRLGHALATLRAEGVLFIGSGFSFHNMQAFFANEESSEQKNLAFQTWLIETCTDKTVSEEVRETRLTHWTEAPFARFCHPREEHLLPLHVCYGLAKQPAELVFRQTVLGKTACALLW
jgi:aromatic ring-opening dioxygenase catalytic subunit (LigB family)